MLNTTPTNLLNLNQDGLIAFFAERGEKPYRSEQVMKWLYHQQVAEFDAMTNLSRVLREQLKQEAEIRPPRVLTEQRSVDGTRKWLLAVDAGNAVETVFIPDDHRGTLCISSQVGCALNCTFCSTATQGFSRNLTTAEIVGQVWHAARALEHDRSVNRVLTNIVFMGMGEPLLNMDAVIPAIDILRHDLGFGFAGKRITVSTAGLVPMIDKLAQVSDVSLAVSLHAANDELRNQLVPLNKKYPIETLLASCRRYIGDRPRASVTFEYTLIDGVNDSPKHARELVRLMQTVRSKVNLIPFNPFPGTRYVRSSDDAIERFQEIVMRSGVITTVRRTRGDDIAAACGQLVGQVKDRTRRSRMMREQMAAPN